MKGRLGVIMFFFLSAQMVLFIPPSTAQQILPGIELECSRSSITIDVGGDSYLETELVDCILTNDRPYVEEVSLEYVSEDIEASGPGSLTVEGGSDISFQVIIDPDGGLSPQIYTLNITAEVVSAVGIPMGFLTDIEEWVVEIEIMEYTNCDVAYSMNSLNVEGGDNALFTASYDCESNVDKELDIELHLVKKNENSGGPWESGFNIISEKCSVTISEGDGFENCEFELTTPSNIEERFEGCLIVLDERKLTAGSCQSENSLVFIVEPKESGLISGVGGNITVLDDYNISEEHLLIFGGGFVTLLALFIIIVRYRRR